ncbi:thymidine phosphorylase [bacterium]|nr:thymidine phosphorylase [bacterium]
MTPSWTEIIRAKRDGKELVAGDLVAFASAAGRGEIPDEQISAFCMAVYFRGMTPGETAAFAGAMRDSGRVVDFGDGPTPVDKHSTGGVGDKVSLALAPLVAACGLRVPMIAGRGLGHTGGTIDKLAAIPGFRTDLSVDQFRRVVNDTGCAIAAQSAEIAPADGRLYAIRDVTATVESVPLIVASILSKKCAEGARALVMDVKCGGGAFMKSREEAGLLAHALIDAGRELGLPVRAILTDMTQPLGRAVGNALEVAEAFAMFDGAAPDDLVEVTMELAAHMLVAGGAERDTGEARARARRAIDDGSARKTAAAWIAAQGGDARVLDDASLLPRAAVVRDVNASRDGAVSSIDAFAIGLAAVELGAGRATLGGRVDPSVGFVLAKKVGDRVRAGEAIGTVHAANDDDAGRAAKRLAGAVSIAEREVSPPALILGAIDA